MKFGDNGIVCEAKNNTILTTVISPAHADKIMKALSSALQTKYVDLRDQAKKIFFEKKLAPVVHATIEDKRILLEGRTVEYLSGFLEEHFNAIEVYFEGATHASYAIPYDADSKAEKLQDLKELCYEWGFGIMGLQDTAGTSQTPQ
jgi:hypothetical protein